MRSVFVFSVELTTGHLMFEFLFFCLMNPPLAVKSFKVCEQWTLSRESPVYATPQAYITRDSFTETPAHSTSRWGVDLIDKMAFFAVLGISVVLFF